MASELTITGSISFSKSGVTGDLAKVAASYDVSGTRCIRHAQTVGTSEEALVLGDVSGTLGFAIFVNRDATNYVEIRSATGAANDIIKLKAGEVAMFRFGSDITAPFAVANTAAVVLEYLIVEN